MFEIFFDVRFWIVMAMGWTVMAAIDTMPDLDADSNLWYIWIYRFAHLAAANARNAFASIEIRSKREKP